jgi:hypothetical protein
MAIKYLAWTLLLLVPPVYAASRPAATPTKARPKSAVIRPNVRGEPTGFQITAVTGKPGALDLHFASTDPSQVLDPKSSIVIQLNMSRGLQVQPSIITSSEWPKGANRMTLAYKGNLTRGTWIDGAATYTTCKTGTTTCRKVQSRIRADFR